MLEKVQYKCAIYLLLSLGKSAWSQEITFCVQLHLIFKSSQKGS